MTERTQKPLTLLRHGQFLTITQKIWQKIYNTTKRMYYHFLFTIQYLFSRKENVTLAVITNHSIAYESPDHVHPYGTKRDNSSNTIFNVKIHRLLRKNFRGVLKFLDLGCAGGGLVKDFKNQGYISVGLEGSDYSLKHGRAEWKELGNKNLFTADITKDFIVISNGKPLRFNLITAWEVMEHIHNDDLLKTFKNIVTHLEAGGYFIASTCSASDMNTGVELHQTRMTNTQWRAWIEKNFNKELTLVSLPFAFSDYVRFGGENSFLTYRKNT